jgi:hypothetical protein
MAVGEVTWTALMERDAPVAGSAACFALNQYSSASITVRTRVVTDASAGSGDISSMSES